MFVPSKSQRRRLFIKRLRNSLGEVVKLFLVGYAGTWVLIREPAIALAILIVWRAYIFIGDREYRLVS